MRIVFAIVASSLMTVTTSVLPPQPKQPASVAGTWTGTYGTPGGARPLNLVLKVDGTKLSGTVRRETGDLPIVGQVKGDSVTFSYTITYNEHALDMSFAAKISADAMNGVVDFGGQGRDTFEAKRASGAGKPPLR